MNKKIIIVFFLLLGTCNIELSVASEKESFHLEKIYLHLQKSIFISGEDLRFQAYSINLTSNKLSCLSNVAYIELINKEGEPVAKQNIILNKGIGGGGIKINELLPTGYYSLNAYTHWGNTVAKELISVYPLYIYNNDTTEEVSEINDNPEINYLKSGEWGTNYSIDSKRELYVKTRLTDLERILCLNVGYSDGNAKYDNPYTLKIKSFTEPEIKKEFRMTDGEWNTQIKLSELPSSIYFLKILDQQGNVLFENTLFKKRLWDRKILEKPRVKIESRQTQRLTFRLSDLSKLSDSLFISASIVRKEPISSAKNIITFQNFYKNFDYKSNAIYQNLEQITNHKWIGDQKILPLWQNIKDTCKQTSNKYIEKGSYVLEGHVVDRITNKPLCNKEIFLSKIGEFADIQPNLTSDTGEFYFSLPLKSGLHDISIQVPNQDSLDLRFHFREKFNSKGIFYPLKSFSPKMDKNNKFLKHQWENQKIRLIYNEHKKESGSSELYHGKKSFYGHPKLDIVLEDYVRLDSVAEYFYELISNVKVKYSQKKAYMRVFSSDQKSLMHQEPLVLYDGLIISDISEILSKNPKDIDRIEVMPYEYYYKCTHFYGIVHMISKNKKCELLSLPRNTERYYLPLFISELEKPIYENPATNHPDFRTDLLWEPNITLTKNKEVTLEFTASDVKGEYELTLEGISEKGEPIVLKQSFLIQ